MGRLSDRMLEYDSEQYFSSHFWMICPACKLETDGEVIVPEPNWARTDYIGQLSSEGPSDLSCNKCNAGFSCFVSFAHGSCSVQLADFPDTVVTADEARYWPPTDDFWLFSTPSEAPFDDFKQAMAEIKKLALEANQIDGESLINRMCFSQSFAVFEAYLADVIINAVNYDPNKRAALIATDRRLSSMKVDLIEVGKNPDLVSNKVNAYLREVLYHNIPRINPMFEAVFGVRVVSDKSVLENVMRLVEDRHDCVHRNGRSKDKEPPNKFSVIFTLDTIRCLENVVHQFEREVKSSEDQEIAF